MRFQVVPNGSRTPNEGRDVGYLWTDNWDDWFEFNTLYVLTYFDNKGVKHDIGGVKIGQFDMAAKQRRPDLPARFPRLDSRFFSLGQDADYYEAIGKLDLETARDLLARLNDIVADEELYQRAREEKVTGTSLMRSVSERTIFGQFRRIVAGGARLTDYTFRYRGPAQIDPEFDPVTLVFEVVPSSRPPSNIQVIIGRNGVGKSHLLNAMSRALVEEEDIDKNGEFIADGDELDRELESPFANIVSVTFSAFDDFPLIRKSKNATKGVRYTNVGLRKRMRQTSDDGTAEFITLTQQPDELTQDFIASAKACTTGQQRRERWRRALRTLESDPIFEEADVTALLDRDPDDLGSSASRLFRKLSSGHKIVLLTITKLVESVEERTLVLMDEPEAHLHPPLLAALIRAVSDLLINRNGVAIVATHSPVVLQEVPRSCVWKLRRHGGGAVIERPEIETFAENVGRLTHEVFGLEVTRSGFYKMIAEAIDANDDFDDVIGKFDGEVGLEGRALISVRIATRDVPDDGDLT
ncbi:ATP-dependent nuclease [Bradyrhizobium sp. SZCCHNR1070]|uniref:ATP-dependent nuclease n=1 Tax=Bradyrhizobium sp. SZCCHNR1070 TaxID=3057361 RepID=UPI002915E7AC|nr:AAA family ATPase [Bradyrhizobium sp. SZCCHNR1070]